MTLLHRTLVLLHRQSAVLQLCPGLHSLIVTLYLLMLHYITLQYIYWCVTIVTSLLQCDTGLGVGQLIMGFLMKYAAIATISLYLAWSLFIGVSRWTACCVSQVIKPRMTLSCGHWTLQGAKVSLNFWIVQQKSQSSIVLWDTLYSRLTDSRC